MSLTVSIIPCDLDLIVMPFEALCSLRTPYLVQVHVRF